MISPHLLRRPKNAGKERKPPAKKEKTERRAKEMTFSFIRRRSLKSTATEGTGEGGVVSYQKKKKKSNAREDRVNEMASKHELNGGRKETRSNLSYLGCLQTLFSAHEVFQSLDSWPELLKGARC